MEKSNYTALFAVIMALILIPFAPAYIEQQFDESNSPVESLSIPTASAATISPQVTEIISTGYLGSYGLAAIPAGASSLAEARVLGIATERPAAPPFQAREINKSNSIINMNSGQAITVWVDFLNTGTAAWHNSGDHYVAVNVSEPAGRQSSFQHEFWKEQYYRPGRLLQSVVRPGEVGRFRFALQAPEKNGIYTEKFNLVAENCEWIEGGYFEFKIGVGRKITAEANYQAVEVKRSHGGTLELNPGQAITFWTEFQNTGLKNWYDSGDNFIAVNVTSPTSRFSPFKHDYWNEYYYRPGKLQQSRIYPNETGRFVFALQAPQQEGYYTEKFTLVAENLTFIPGSELTIKFKVGDPQPAPVNNTLTNEPTIRIGLFETSNSVLVTANGNYTVTNMNNQSVDQKSKNQITTTLKSNTTYKRLVPDNDNTIMEISSWDNRSAWKQTLNDNTFRGTIEIRYIEETGSLWVINELPIESYLKGLAEVSNEQPQEYLKSLLTAARSYALWHQTRGGRHPDKYFDINATTDQIYRGYGFEQRSIDPVQAVMATAGQVITHPDAISQINPLGIALAPYSSGTDGRTRSWNEVWSGGGYAWIESVDDPHGAISNWDTLTGNHMVGMSAMGARGYATEENKTYDWILEHYYTGVAVKKLY